MSNSGGPRIALMERLVNKAGGVRSEATIQSDVRLLLLDPELGLAEAQLDVQLEAQVGDGRRIDVEVGCTVIEVKRSLRGVAEGSAVVQLSGYVRARAAEMGQRYVGILTDGQLWIAFHEIDGSLREATRFTAVVGESGAVALLRWLEGVLATKRAVRPTPVEIVDRLGAQSSSHALDYSTLAALYTDSRGLPTVTLKRELWARLLRSALGTQFTDSDELFLEHTLLVNSAEIIAHLVLGLDAEQLSPATLLSGDQFARAGLHGVVDRDFFDWVLEVPGGDGFVTALARRLARFDWSQVEHDVLKVLYESVISAETRKVLGEYYTPDWLANRVVAQVVTDPLSQRVLDPSCGSGTFVFYAVKRYLAAAAAAGMSLQEAMGQVSSRVMGIDLHPVAVALARVTYLLALGRERLNSPDRGSLSVPIYLGDSLGWDLREDLLSVDHLVIPTEEGDQLPSLSGELRFADHLLSNSAVFDDLVESLVGESGRAAHRAISRLSEGTVRRLAIDPVDLPAINANFVRLKELHEAERNHIWSYYIRNVSRPAWLAREENRVDVLIGNPPWLSYRHMTPAMQTRFKSLATTRGFWHNETTATHQDLAGLFVARAVERYLTPGGTVAFVVPNSVIDRDYWRGFRRGAFDGANVRFTTSWDLRRIRPHLFPRGSAVIYATRTAAAAPMPSTALIWTGKAPHRHANIDTAQQLRQEVGELTVGTGNEPRSPYAARFSQGANLVPRLLFRVEEVSAGALGTQAGHVNLRSQRTVSEKKPWKDLPDLTGIVESEFVWPTVLGEQVVPFRQLPPATFVIPLTGKGQLLSGEHPHIEAYPGLADWTRQSETVWAEHGSSKMTLAEQIDHMSKLTQQLPGPRLRVAYAASGMHVAATLVTDPGIVIEHAVYWAAVRTEDEGHYLVGILNAPALTDLARPHMSYGKDERHIDKNVWKLPIPTFDPTDDTHAGIARIARELAEEISTMTFRSDNFVTIRRDLRTHLANHPTATTLNGLVARLLGQTEDTDDVPTAPVQPADEAPPVLIRTSPWPLPALTAPTQIDVDCEYDRAGQVYLWGALTTRPGHEPQYQAFGSAQPDVDETALAADFHSWLREQLGPDGRWFYYGRVEAQHLVRILGADIVGETLTVGVDVLAEALRPSFYAPQGFGLKHLAPAAGAQWRTTGATGADTLEWVAAARAGQPESWRQLLEYNEDDTRALARLRQVIATAGGPGWTLHPTAPG